MSIAWLRTIDFFGWTLWIERFEKGGWSVGVCRGQLEGMTDDNKEA